MSNNTKPVAAIPPCRNKTPFGVCFSLKTNANNRIPKIAAKAKKAIEAVII